MCLYPKIIKNKKYLPNKKNGGKPEKPKDKRVLAVPVKCGKCIECRKAISREWQIRLQQEIKSNREAIFVTLTFNEESLCELKTEFKETKENQIATIATRRFLERWRKRYGNSVKHWLITELGHQNTERIHLHGLIFTQVSKTELEDLWKYGIVWVGEYVNAKTINYIVKYVTKIDNDHPNFQGKILCSPGIGKGYNTARNRYKGTETIENFVLNNGQRVGLPIYYRNKAYNEDEREKLWIDKIDKGIRYVMGQKVNVKTKEGQETYYKLLEAGQKHNKFMKYGNPEWNKAEYLKSRELIGDIDNYQKF